MSAQPSDTAPRWAAAILLASPLAALLGLVATTDAPLMACWAAALAGLWSALVRRRRGGWLLFVLATGIGLLAKYTLAALIVGACLFVLQFDRSRWRELVLAIVAALLLAAPNLAWNAQAGWPTLRHTAEITVTAGGQGGWIALAGFVAAQLVCLAPLAAPVWWLSRGRPTLHLPPPAAAFLLLTTLPLLLAGLLQAWRSGAQINWIAPAHLAATLAWALWLARSPLGLQRRVALVMLLQALLLAALVLAPRAAAIAGHPLPAQLDVWARQRGWGQALAQVADALPTEGDVIVVSPSRTVMAQAAYHWRDRGITRQAWRERSVASQHYELACPFEAVASGIKVHVLVVLDGPPSAALQARLGPLQLLLQLPVTVTASRRIELQLLRATHAVTIDRQAPRCR